MPTCQVVKSGKNPSMTSELVKLHITIQETAVCTNTTDQAVHKVNDKDLM